MCGIFTYIGNEHTETELKCHSETLQSRGPDDSQLITLPIARSRESRYKLRVHYEDEFAGNKDNIMETTSKSFTFNSEPSRFVDNKKVIYGFHRLKVNGQDMASNQPLELNGVYLICNGEIYNHKEIERKENFKMKSQSDCEVILHLYHKFGIQDTISRLDGVFAFVIYDTNTANLYVARDPIGVRPIFIGKIEHKSAKSEVIKQKNHYFDMNGLNKEQNRHQGEEPYDLTEKNYEGQFPLSEFIPANFHDSYIFSSEMKACSLCTHVDQFPPGNFWSPDYGFQCYWTPTPSVSNIFTSRHMRTLAIRRQFTEGVIKRLMSDLPIGVLLSGGVDSSLVAAIVNQYITRKKGESTLGAFPGHNLHSFSIGTEYSPDLKAAQKVADYLGTIHHIVKFTPEEGIATIPKVIKSLETYDITTIRASTPMYLLSKYISENTDIKVILSGEGSDELFGGYLYFHNAPSPQEFQQETQRLITNLHKYDVLRSDRSTASHGLEVRVPFLDKEFVKLVLSTDPREKWCRKIESGYKMHHATTNPNFHSESSTEESCTRINDKLIEKKLLRDSFDMINPMTNKPLLPEDVLWRTKDGMSDAVGYNWVDSILTYTETLITDIELKDAHNKWPHNTPKTKEAYWYRQIFEELYPSRSHILHEMWLPKWCGEHTDPSARKLEHFNLVSKEDRF